MGQEPVSLTQAASRMGGTFVGGCTDLMPLLKNKVRFDNDLVLLSHIPELQGIREEDGKISIGAAVTLTEAAQSPLLRDLLPAAAQGAEAVASLQIRNIATVGGNLFQDRRCIYFNQSEHWRSALPLCFKTGGAVCHQAPNSPVCRAIYYSDLATALVVYDARAEYWEDGRLRRAPLAELIERHSKANGLSWEHHLPVLLVRVLVDRPPEGERSGFFKYAMRTSIDFPLINFALRRGGGRPAKLVAGAVGPRPAELPDTAALLDCAASDEEIVSACKKELAALAGPIREACIPPARKRDLYGMVEELLYLR